MIWQNATAVTYTCVYLFLLMTDGNSLIMMSTLQYAIYKTQYSLFSFPQTHLFWTAFLSKQNQKQ